MKVDVAAHALGRTELSVADEAGDGYRERVKYDHVIVDDDLERAVAEICGLLGLGKGRKP